jgi:signal transduction histidine kinase/CheY-like chemotaxis protein
MLIPDAAAAPADGYASGQLLAALTGPWAVLLAAGLVVALAALALTVWLRLRVRADARAAGLPLRVASVRGLKPTLALALLLFLAALVVPFLRQPGARQDAAQLRQFRGQTFLLDERLTMSARLAAASGESRWEDRYRQAEKDLDVVLEQSDALLEQLLGPEAAEARAAVGDTSQYNDALIALENQCFDLVRAGDRAEAFGKVLSPEYERLKGLYADAVARSDRAIEQLIDRAVAHDEHLAIAAGVLGVLATAVTIVGLLLLARALARHTSALSASETRLRTLTNTMPGVAYRCRPDAQRSVVVVSDGVQEIAGRPAADFRGEGAQGLLQLAHPDDRPAVLAEIAAAVAARRPYVLEYRVPRPDGTLCHVWERGVPVFADPADTEPAWLDGVCVDATERWQAQQDLARARDAAMAAGKAKAEFLANMSHEIRTPMNAVIGMTGLLLESDLTPEQREDAETVQSSADSLLVLINDILDFSKLEAGKLEFEHLDFDVGDVVEEVAAMMRHSVSAKGLELTTDVAPDVPATLSGDAGRVRQVLVNLVGNAIKFTEAGEVAVRAQRESESATDTVVRFEVRDTGVGISADRIGLLFQPFMQADSSTSRRFGGTGLGLAICRQLVELMGGRIGCDSEAGRGSCFWFTCRFARRTAHDGPSAQPIALFGRRLLVVDDTASNRRILKTQLEARGAEVECAEGGAAALQLVRERMVAGRPFDAGVLDLLMPGMTGLELAHELLAQGVPLPLVLLTSSASRGDSERYRAAGFAAWLSKPARPERIVRALLSALALPGGATAEATGAAPERPAARAQAHILVADDNQVNQRVAQKMLAKLGYRADGVANGAEVLAALRRQHYDIVLMDCQMPDVDGWQAARAIRSVDEPWKNVRIIALTANALVENRQRCFDAGMDDYVVKPVTLHELRDAVERNMARREATEPAGQA